MKTISKILSAAVLSVGIAVSTLAPAYAVTGGGDGMKISPVRTDLTINPGSSATFNVMLTNVTSQTTTYRAIINDFVAGNNENGQPSVILDPSKSAPSHGLKQYISPIPDFTVNPGATATEKVTVTIPKGVAGGGYYGAIRFLPVLNGTKNENVSLSASVATLVLVKVPGNIVDNVVLSSFDVRTSKDALNGSSLFTKNKPLYAVVRFQNKGNVQEQPFGKVVLKKGNTILQTAEINDTDPRANVLPGTIRRFSVSLDKVGNFGKYTVEGNFGYGSKGQLLSATSTFYVVPVGIIALAILVLLVILFLIFGLPRLIRRYNQNVLRRAGRR